MRSDSVLEFSVAGLEDVQRGVEGLRGCARQGLPAGRLTELVRATVSVRNQLESALNQLIGDLDQQMKREQDADDPALSCAVWLREELHMTNSAAWGQVRLARQLHDLPATAASFARGRLSYQHAMAITRTVDRVVLSGGPGGEAEAMLLQESGGRNPQDLLRWGRHLRHRLNPAELADEAAQAHRPQWLSLIQSWDGGYDLEGHLDAENGTTLKVALQGLLGPRSRDDERSHAQRRAEGLGLMARRCLDSGELPVRGRGPASHHRDRHPGDPSRRPW